MNYLFFNTVAVVCTGLVVCKTTSCTLHLMKGNSRGNSKPSMYCLQKSIYSLTSPSLSKTSHLFSNKDGGQRWDMVGSEQESKDYMFGIQPCSWSYVSRHGQTCRTSEWLNVLEECVLHTKFMKIHGTLTMEVIVATLSLVPEMPSQQ